MHADAAMNLVMHTDLLIRLVFIPFQLNAVHSQIGIHEAAPSGGFCINLRQRDKGAAVIRPAFELRQIADANLILHHGPGSARAGQHVEQGKRNTFVSEGMFPEPGRIYFQFNQMVNSL